MSGSSFHYDGAGRREALDSLFEAAYRPGARVVISGAAGSGRSWLLHRFREEADPDVLAIATATGDILMSGEQCLSALAASLAPGGCSDPDAAIGHALAEGRRVVFVVDEAHELGEKPRQVLLDFCAAQSVSLVLVTDPGMLSAEDAVLITMRPFSVDESEEFVAAWLAVGDEDELPSHRAVEKLQKRTGGMPGALLAQLEAGAASRNTWYPAGLPPWHMVFVVASLGVLLLVLAWLAPEEKKKQAEVQQARVSEIAVPLPASGDAEPSRGEIAPGTRASAVAVPRPVAIAPLPVEPSARPLPAATPEKIPEGTATRVPLPESQPAMAPAAPAPVVAASPAAPRKPVSVRRYTADEDALLREKATGYTLQLFASFNEQATRQFSAANAPAVAAAGAPEGIRLFRTVREELPWYVAVSGSYRNKDEAKAAVAKLPASLRKLQPWARSFQGIQDELRRRRD